MPITELEQSLDVDFWFATDALGAVGCFRSDGEGAIPKSVLANFTLDSLHDLTEQVLSLSEQSVVIESQNVIRDRSWTYVDAHEGKAMHLESMAAFTRRGLFVFFARGIGVWNGPYNRALIPTKPLHLGDLPVELQNLIAIAQLNTVSFADIEELNPADVQSSPK